MEKPIGDFSGRGMLHTIRHDPQVADSNADFMNSTALKIQAPFFLGYEKDNTVEQFAERGIDQKVAKFFSSVKGASDYRQLLSTQMGYCEIAKQLNIYKIDGMQIEKVEFH